MIKKRPLFNTRTSLANVPTEWLRHIEPFVMRGAWLPCWVWMGDVDRNGYPIMWNSGEGKRSYAMVHRFVAKIFFDFPNHYMVRRSCNTINCVNPNHLRVTSRHHKQESS